MVAFFTLAASSICHHLQLLHKPHFEAFPDIVEILLADAMETRLSFPTALLFLA